MSIVKESDAIVIKIQFSIGCVYLNSQLISD